VVYPALELERGNPGYAARSRGRVEPLGELVDDRDPAYLTTSLLRLAIARA
jgi:hypothetical protein